MKFRLTITLIILIPINISAQKKSLAGTYGICESIYDCFQLKLEEDSTFSYYVNEYISGKGIVNGHWKTLKDTLFLDITYLKKEIPIINRYFVDTIQGKKIIFLTTDFYDLQLQNVNVVINDSINLITNNNCEVYVDISTINKIELISELISDKIFYFDDNYFDNTIELNIPIDRKGFVELIYTKPTKWLINNKELIPFELIGGEYQLVDNKSIKKVKRRKVVQELREDF